MDINALLLRIKDNINAIEGGDHREPLLDEVCSDFLEMLELIKLFLISERDSYYGYFMMNMQFSVDFTANIIAGIKLNTFPPVFEANPLILCKFSLKEILFTVCHEIDHIVLNHPTEMVKANPDKNEELFRQFNLAADASVNDRILYEIKKEKHKFMKAPEGIITSKVLGEMFDLNYIASLENYAYYFDLIKDLKEDESGNADGNSGDETEDEGTSDSTGDGTADDGIVTALNCGELKDHDWDAGEDADDAQANVKEFVNASVGMMNDESRGLMPGFFMSQVELINKPATLSWQAVLKKYVGTVNTGKRKTRTRLNRRQPERFDLSGRVDEKILKIVVAIDTSGSVSDEMIAQIFNEIFAILAKRKHEITVIECDSSVQRVYVARTPADIQLKAAGRGGTCFTPVIDYVNNDKYYRDALLIYFTDGYGEFEIPKPRTYRNLWVVFDDARHLSVNEPYGTVLTL